MRRVLLAALIAAPLPAMADCLSIGPAAEFCPGDAWTFEKYVDEGVVHIAAESLLDALGVDPFAEDTDDSAA